VAGRQSARFRTFRGGQACRLPTLTDHIRRCELFGIPEDKARQRFRDFMRTRSAPEAVAFPPTTIAVSNIPIRVPVHFMGREEPLEAISKALKRYEGRVAITALHGLRGVGKTTLAAAYAEHHSSEYRATWWIRAQTDSSTRADLIALGVRLGWVGAEDKEGPALAMVMERLRQEGAGILLVFDNAIVPRARGPICRVGAPAACSLPRTRMPGAALPNRLKSGSGPSRLVPIT
jgi:hypothetical protein